MEAEASSFESSEMVAAFLASTPLLSESWKLCRHANNSAHGGFAANQIGDVTYVAFSGVQAVDGMNLNPNCRNLVPLDNTLFSALHLQVHGEADEPAMVHAGFLHLFLSIFNTHNFQNQMFEIMKKSKPVIFTGHSVGGAIASLAALWLLSHFQSISSPLPVFCITFGSPLLGNEPLSRAILQERWGGNFCHLVAKHDIVPRLLFAPLTLHHLHFLLQFWHLSLSSPHGHTHLPDHQKSELFHFVLAACDEAIKGAAETSSFWPFGSFMFCTNEGAICVDNGVAIVKLLYVMLATGSGTSCIDDHLKYEEYVWNVSRQFLKRRGFMEGEMLPESSYEAGVALALQSSEIASHEPVSGPVKDCLKMAKRMGRTRNINCASLAIGLAKITPLRAQIEWYKATCDESDDQMGYYDSFKQRDASRREFKVNMNRIKLAKFWDNLIHMLKTNQLPHDFEKRAKYVNASQFYKLLVEPLDIAKYYGSGMHRQRGHYIEHGRERRYEIFDRWWRERKVSEEENKNRSKFAGLTQDSCFWARVEEAREWIENVRSESDTRKIALLWENIDKFEQYARKMVERKEVSRDVMAKYSSYSLWVEELRELKLQL